MDVVYWGVCVVYICVHRVCVKCMCCRFVLCVYGYVRVCGIGVRVGYDSVKVFFTPPSCSKRLFLIQDIGLSIRVRGLHLALF